MNASRIMTAIAAAALASTMAASAAFAGQSTNVNGGTVDTSMTFTMGTSGTVSVTVPSTIAAAAEYTEAEDVTFDTGYGTYYMTNRGNAITVSAIDITAKPGAVTTTKYATQKTNYNDGKGGSWCAKFVWQSVGGSGLNVADSLTPITQETVKTITGYADKFKLDAGTLAGAESDAVENLRISGTMYKPVKNKVYDLGKVVFTVVLQ